MIKTKNTWHLPSRFSLRINIRESSQPSGTGMLFNHPLENTVTIISTLLSPWEKPLLTKKLLKWSISCKTALISPLWISFLQAWISWRLSFSKMTLEIPRLEASTMDSQRARPSDWSYRKKLGKATNHLPLLISANYTTTPQVFNFESIITWISINLYNAFKGPLSSYTQNSLA